MNWIIFLTALIMVESGDDPYAIGDKHLTNKAYGICQIRQPYLDDVNRIEGTSYTLTDVRNNRGVSRWCVIRYVTHYGARYTRQTGNPLTYEIAARIHNGGPNGWKKSSTDDHWNKVQAEIRRLK